MAPVAPLLMPAVLLLLLLLLVVVVGAAVPSRGAVFETWRSSSLERGSEDEFEVMVAGAGGSLRGAEGAALDTVTFGGVEVAEQPLSLVSSRDLNLPGDGVLGLSRDSSLGAVAGVTPLGLVLPAGGAPGRLYTGERASGVDASAAVTFAAAAVPAPAAAAPGAWMALISRVVLGSPAGAPADSLAVWEAALSADNSTWLPAELDPASECIGVPPAVHDKLAWAFLDRTDAGQQPPLILTLGATLQVSVPFAFYGAAPGNAGAACIRQTPHFVLGQAFLDQVYVELDFAQQALTLAPVPPAADEDASSLRSVPLRRGDGPRRRRRNSEQQQQQQQERRELLAAPRSGVSFVAGIEVGTEPQALEVALDFSTGVLAINARDQASSDLPIIVGAAGGAAVFLCCLFLVVSLVVFRRLGKDPEHDSLELEPPRSTLASTNVSRIGTLS